MAIYKTNKTSKALGEYLVSFLAIAAFGIGVAYILVPDESDTAFVSLRDQNISDAIYRYEKLIEKEGYQVRYVDALSRAYTLKGEVRKAVALVEEYVRRNPERIDAIKQLASMYAVTQQRAARIAMLEKLAKLEESPEPLMELLAYYQLTGDTENQARISTQLYSLYPEMMAEPPVRLSKILAGQGDLQKAADILVFDYENRPQSYSNNEIVFLVELLLNVGRTEKAQNITEAQFKRKSNPLKATDAVTLAGLFTDRNFIEYAYSLVEPMAEKTQEPLLLAEKVRLQVLLEQNRAVIENERALLASLGRNEKLNPNIVSAFIGAAVARADIPSIIRLLEINSTVLTKTTWVQIAEVAAQNGRPEQVRELLRHYMEQNPEGINDFPALALSLNTAQNSDDAYKKLMAMHRNGELDTQERISLARIFTLSGRNDAAVDVVKVFNKNTVFANGDYLPLVNIYLLTDSANLGLKLFNSINASPYKKPSAFHVAHKLIEVANDRKELPKVLAWLESQPYDTRLQQMSRDLYFVALDNNLDDLAYGVASFMYEKQVSEETAQMLLWSALQVGKEDQALAKVDEAYLELPSFETINVVLLARKAQTDKTAARKLEALVKKIVNDPTVTDIRKQEVLALLIENKQHRIALPYLKDLALREQSSVWLFAYVEAASKAGQTSEAANMLRQNYRQLNLTEEEKTNFGFYFLEGGATKEALELFKLTAAEYGPQSIAAENLIFLWTTSPDRAEPDWLYNQAIVAPSKDVPLWLGYMLDLTAYKQIIGVVDSRYGSNIPDNILMYRLVAGLETGEDTSKIDAQLKGYIARSENVVELSDLGLRLVQADKIDYAIMAFERALVLEPNNVEVSVTAAQAMLNQSRYTRAQRILEPLVKNPEHKAKLGWRGHVVYGLALSGMGRRQEAGEPLQKGLKEFPEEEKLSQDNGGLYAQALFREGERKEAIKHYEKLLRLYPNVLALETDYAALLLEDGQLDKAQKVLDKTGKVQTRNNKK